MNTNLITTIALCAIFGAISRAIYQSFLPRRKSIVINTFYALFLWQGFFWVFYESMTNVFSMVLGIFFLLTFFITSSALPIKETLGSKQYLKQTAHINPHQF